MAGTNDAPVEDILAGMTTFAMQELASRGLVQAYGPQIPETYNGAGITMLFWAKPDGQNTVTPRTMGQVRAGFGQRTEVHAIQGCLVVGSRERALFNLLGDAYPWVERAFDAFWLHIQLGGLVQELRPVGYHYDPKMPWGDDVLFCVIFDWNAETILRKPAGM